MDKKIIIEEYIKFLDEKVKSAEISLKTVRKEAVDAPGSNVSHSDTSKFQLSNVALGMEQRLSALKRQKAAMATMEVKNYDKIEIGAIFIVKYLKSEKETYYFLISEEGGDTLEIEKKKIVFVSPSAPIVRIIARLTEGDYFDSKGVEMQLVKIY